MRDNIILKCTECGEENYIDTRNKKTHPERKEIKKYCPRCNKMTLHKENGFYKRSLTLPFGSFALWQTQNVL